MALPSSGNSISLNQMHVEVGGSSGSTCTLNDSDIRGLISKSAGASMGFNEWFGASAFTADTAITVTPASSGIKNDNPRFTTYNFYLAPIGTINDNQVTLVSGSTYYIHSINGNQAATTGVILFSTSSSPTGGGGSASYFDGTSLRTAAGTYGISGGTAHQEVALDGSTVAFTGFKGTIATNNPLLQTSGIASETMNIY